MEKFLERGFTIGCIVKHFKRDIIRRGNEPE